MTIRAAETMKRSNDTTRRKKSARHEERGAGMEKKRLIIPNWGITLIKGAIGAAMIAGMMIYLGNSYAAACGLPAMFTW